MNKPTMTLGELKGLLSASKTFDLLVETGKVSREEADFYLSRLSNVAAPDEVVMSEEEAAQYLCEYDRLRDGSLSVFVDAVRQANWRWRLGLESSEVAYIAEKACYEYEKNPGKHAGMAQRLASCAAINFVREDRGRHIVDSQSYAAEPDRTVEPEASAIGNIMVQAIIEMLPRSHREAFRLRVIEEMPYSEISVLLGMSASNARKQVHRAREYLRQQLAALGIAEQPINLSKEHENTPARILTGCRDTPSEDR